MYNFDGIHGNFGLGCMRLPGADGIIDIEQTKQMVDEFIAAGFNYFDTAHGYHSEQSEPTVKICLTDRYPRDKYILTNKLSDSYFSKQEDIRPLFDLQLSRCGVDYFDFYLMHAQSRRNYEQYRRCHAYETAFELKQEGKVRYVGISFHDTAEELERILDDHPQLDAVQLQLNYLDWNDAAGQSRLCHQVCVNHGVPVIVMEPVKGGRLANLPSDALAMIRQAGMSPAELALRFAASQQGVFMVLSGMSNIEQMRENISVMKDFHPLTDKEKALAKAVAGILRGENIIPCTACRYCTDGCPMHIDIPDLFTCLNGKLHFDDSKAASDYAMYTRNGGKASDCIKCGKCEKSCPQGLKIRQLLCDVASEFENK